MYKLLSSCFHQSKTKFPFLELQNFSKVIQWTYLWRPILSAKSMAFKPLIPGIPIRLIFRRCRHGKVSESNGKLTNCIPRILDTRLRGRSFWLSRCSATALVWVANCRLWNRNNTAIVREIPVLKHFKIEFEMTKLNVIEDYQQVAIEGAVSVLVFIYRIFSWIGV